MYQNDSQSIELNIKDIVLFVLRKAHILALSGFFLGVVLGGYGYFKSSISAPDNSSIANVLDINTRIDGESDIEYENRVQLVNRAQTIMANIDTMNAQSERLSNYISNSIIMQIDPMNVSVSEAQLIIVLDKTESVGLDDALIDSYALTAQAGDYIGGIAESFGYETGSLQELIYVDNVEYNKDLVLSEDTAPVRMLTIRVYGDSLELTETILNGALNEIYDKFNNYNSSIAKHSIAEIGRKSYVTFVSLVRESQLKTMTTYQTLQSQIDYGNKYLDDIAKQLGLTDRNSFYSNVTAITANNETRSFPVKYILIGFVLGIVGAACIYVCKYVFGRKIVTKKQFFCFFPECTKIGVLKPFNKRSKLTVILDRLSGDDTELDADINNELVSANLKNLTQDMNKVLVTGTISEKTAKEVARLLRINSDVQADIFNNPRIFENASDYDGVVILEQRGVSEKALVKQEIELIKNGAKQIIGAIIV